MATCVDIRRAEDVFSRLVGAYSRKEYPFNLPETVPPQIAKNLPKSITWGSREHALFLFSLCYWMRGGIESHTATRQLAKLYEQNPEIFLPEYGDLLVPKILSSFFRVVGLGFNADQIARLWQKNLITIKDLWNSDPRTIFNDVTTYEEACERIQNRRRKGFGGFQEKMVSMIIYFYMDAGIIDRWNFPIPVDFHVLRTVFAHEIVKARSRDANANGFYTRPVLASVRALCEDYCRRFNVDPLILCEALWLYSRTMCDKHPGNRSIVSKRRGRRTKVRPVTRWTESQARTYEQSCNSCVVNGTCRWLVPSAEYYVRGRITLRGMRDSPPQQSLFPILVFSLT